MKLNHLSLAVMIAFASAGCSERPEEPNNPESSENKNEQSNQSQGNVTSLNGNPSNENATNQAKSDFYVIKSLRLGMSKDDFIAAFPESLQWCSYVQNYSDADIYCLFHSTEGKRFFKSHNLSIAGLYPAEIQLLFINKKLYDVTFNFDTDSQPQNILNALTGKYGPPNDSIDGHLEWPKKNDSAMRLYSPGIKLDRTYVDGIYYPNYVINAAENNIITDSPIRVLGRSYTDYDINRYTLKYFLDSPQIKTDLATRLDDLKKEFQKELREAKKELQSDI